MYRALNYLFFQDDDAIFFQLYDPIFNVYHGSNVDVIYHKFILFYFFGKLHRYPEIRINAI